MQQLQAIEAVSGSLDNKTPQGCIDEALAYIETLSEKTMAVTEIEKSFERIFSLNIC